MDRDLEASDVAAPTTPVKEFMTKKVITIWDDQGIFNATQYLLGHHIRRLPIVDRDERLVGMVASDDLLSLLARELSNLAKAIEPGLALKSF